MSPTIPGWPVSIPLRTGLGFEPATGLYCQQCGWSQSPYERVSDSNKARPDTPTKAKESQSPYERVSDSNG